MVLTTRSAKKSSANQNADAFTLPLPLPSANSTSEPMPTINATESAIAPLPLSEAASNLNSDDAIKVVGDSTLVPPLLAPLPVSSPVLLPTLLPNTSATNVFQPSEMSMLGRITGVNHTIEEARARGAIPRRLFTNSGEPLRNELATSADADREEEELMRQIARQRRVLALRRELAELELQTTVQVVSNPTLSVGEGHHLAESTLARPSRIRLDEVKPLIAVFPGNNAYPVKKWIRDFEYVMESMAADPLDLLRIARQLFTEAAALFIRNKVYYDWASLKAALMDEFHCALKPSEVYHMLRSRRIGQNEGVHQYILEMQQIADLGPCDPEEVIQNILHGLNDTSSAFAILANASTLAELKKLVPRYESMRRRPIANYTDRARPMPNYRQPQLPQRSAPRNNQPAMVPATNAAGAKLIPREQIRCFNCSNLGHFSSDCPMPPKARKNVCFRCNQEGHRIVDCPLKRQVAAILQEDQARGFDWNEDVEREEMTESTGIIHKVRVHWNQVNIGNSYINCILNCLIDTGSPTNLIRASKVPAAILDDKRIYTSMYRGLGNHKLQCYGTINISVEFQQQTHIVNCLILPDHLLPMDLLVGRSFMQLYGIALHITVPHTNSILHKFWNKLCQLVKLSKREICESFENFMNKIKIIVKNHTPTPIVFDLERVPIEVVRTSHNDGALKLASVDRVSNVCSKSFIAACRDSIHKLHNTENKGFEKNSNDSEAAQMRVISEKKENELWSYFDCHKNNHRRLFDTEKTPEEKVCLDHLNIAKSECIVSDFIDTNNETTQQGVPSAKFHDNTCRTEYLKPHIELPENDIFHIDLESQPEVDIGIAFEPKYIQECKQIIDQSYIYAHKPKYVPDTGCMKIRLTSDVPIYVSPRRLSHSDKEIARKQINELINEGVIQPSSSEYASPIVLVKKKNGEHRMCIDYRALNNITCKDNFPLPLMDDCIEFLGGKTCFSIIDLKSGFHQLRMDQDSIKFTAFVTPFGQYEYVRMPFGLKNGPSVFQRWITTIFRDMVEEGEIVIYIDDILIATHCQEEHLRILDKLLKRIVQSGLEIKLSKCHFFKNQIDYLGYVADAQGIRPNDAHIKSIAAYPQPVNLKTLQSCLGLFQYFRRFVPNFSRIAHPLTELLKKDKKFNFNAECVKAFELLKSALMTAPVLSIYDPKKETELHTDASSHGFGAVLMQRQEDGKLHPVAYYSKKASEVESKYHSFELETMAIIYGLRRFEIMLKGIPFKIVTDCMALPMTLAKREVNPRIARWEVELRNYAYTIIHRKGCRMGHVDALSRNIALITVDEVELQLRATQNRDEDIVKIRERLEQGQVDKFEMVNGLIYRYNKSGSMALYVAREMERNVIQLIHDKFGHLGVNKCCEQIKSHYWFPLMKEKVQNYIENCIRCIMHSVPPREQRNLHPIPKKPIPFDTLHIDHYGPLPNITSKKRHILGLSDAFTKFVKLYAVNTTSAKEVIAVLKKYFSYYSRPRRMIMDRAACFTCDEFVKFLKEQNIEQILVATASPQANGQIERVNRVLTPMIGKLTEVKNQSDWSSKLEQVEFALNNSLSSTTKIAPSMLKFGALQRGPIIDELSEYLDELKTDKQANLVDLRHEADLAIKMSQEKSLERHIKKVAPAKTYQIGDYVVIRNISTTVGVNKKLLPKYKGPYVIKEVLPHDRYIVQDIENCQITQMPYSGTIEASRIKNWIRQ